MPRLGEDENILRLSVDLIQRQPEIWRWDRRNKICKAGNLDKLCLKLSLISKLICQPCLVLLSSKLFNLTFTSSIGKRRLFWLEMIPSNRINTACIRDTPGHSAKSRPFRKLSTRWVINLFCLPARRNIENEKISEPLAKFNESAD